MKGISHGISAHNTKRNMPEFAWLISFVLCSWLHLWCDSCRWGGPGDSSAECAGHQQTHPSGMHIKSYVQLTAIHILNSETHTCNWRSTLYMRLHCSYYPKSLYGSIVASNRQYSNTIKETIHIEATLHCSYLMFYRYHLLLRQCPLWPM